MNEYFASKKVQTDSLTQLYLKDDVLNYARYLCGEKIPFSLLFVDVDNFRYINETYGERAGDRILRTVAQKIKEKIGSKGVTGRLENDKFVAVIENKTTYDEAWSFCHELLVNIYDINIPDCEGFSITLTMGISRFPENCETFEDLYESAEKSLMRGKSKGRNCFIVYVPEKHSNIEINKQETKSLSSTTLISKVFKFLSSDNLAGGISTLFNFLSSYYEIDHLCIQSGEKILFQKINQKSKFKNYTPIPHQLILEGVNPNTEMYCVPDVRQLLETNKMELFESLARQNITAINFFDISYQGKNYGLLRADLNRNQGDSKIWQDSDRDVFLTVAKTIGLMLHFLGTDLTQLQ